MSSFAALMALSASQTRQSEAAVQSALVERQRKEALKRKQQEEKEAKEREIERKLRVKHLEDQKREEERRKRLDEERRRKEEELKRKEGEQRDALRYGPKRPSSQYPSSSSGSDPRKRRPATSDDDDESGGGSALTREEKRRMRLQRELNYGSGAHKRPVAGMYRKGGRRLPGGAVDATVANGSPPSNSYRSVKERLTHEPNALIKLNVNKRDTRTIDEILQDRARQKAAKTLEGDDAKGFDNWFGKSKPKAEPAKPDFANAASRASSTFSSRSNSPERKPSAEAYARPTKSLSSTPPATSKAAAPARPVSHSAASQSSSVARLPPLPSFKGTGIHVRAIGKMLDKASISATNGSSSKSLPAKKTSSSVDKVPARSSISGSKPSATSKSQSAPPRKRQRSPSLSDSPPPPKRRTQGGQSSNISAEIWKMFGKDRNAYVARDVFSDDEDMEADALEVEHEEQYSAKVARKEDEAAAEEERRHEEEKRRKRKERERELKERRG